MVREWGMSEEIGPMAWENQQHVFLGEDLMNSRPRLLRRHRPPDRRGDRQDPARSGDPGQAAASPRTAAASTSWPRSCSTRRPSTAPTWPASSSRPSTAPPPPGLSSSLSTQARCARARPDRPGGLAALGGQGLRGRIAAAPAPFGLLASPRSLDDRSHRLSSLRERSEPPEHGGTHREPAPQPLERAQRAAPGGFRGRRERSEPVSQLASRALATSDQRSVAVIGPRAA